MFKRVKIKYDKDGYCWDETRIKSRPLVHLCMTYEQFVESQKKYFTEEAFYYKDKVIDFWCNGMDFSYSYSDKEKLIQTKTFCSPAELFENARFEGKSLKDIWNELR